MSHFAAIYEGLIRGFLHGKNVVVEENRRTGEKCLILPGGLSFLMPMSSLPLISLRKTYLTTGAAESAWFCTGQQSTEWLKTHCKIWEKFEEPLPHGKSGIPNAYGYRWRKHFGRDQLREAIETLRQDPSSRRVWVTAWDPAFDGLQNPQQKNAACPIGFAMNIVDNLLHCSYFIRSSDVFVGLPYDVMGQAMLMGIIASELNVNLGTMHVTLAHAHMYNLHVPLAREALELPKIEPFLPTIILPEGEGIDTVAADPDKFVALYKSLELQTKWPTYNCRPDIVL